MWEIPTSEPLLLRRVGERPSTTSPPLRALRARLLAAVVLGSLGVAGCTGKADGFGDTGGSGYMDYSCPYDYYTVCSPMTDALCEDSRVYQYWLSSPYFSGVWICEDAGDPTGPAFQEYVSFADGCYVMETLESTAEICAYSVSCWRYDCCGYGRPYVADGAAVLATAQRAPGWTAPDLSPSLADLSPEARRRLAAHWSHEGLSEHSSVAGFHRFALDLLAHGAPPELVSLAQTAAAQELGHTRGCFSLASAYAGEPLGPGPLPLGTEAPIARDLVQLAEWTAVEGAIGETLACWLAQAALERAEDPAVRALLQRVVEEETAHAELAWRTLAWALEAGGEPVRRRLQQVFADPQVGVPARGVVSAAMAAHGVLDEATMAAAARACVDEVIRPVAASLLADVVRSAA